MKRVPAKLGHPLATQKCGLWIDRNKPVQFSFQGRTLYGFKGDSLASALAANNIQTISRSLKYRRKRGIFSMAGAEANTLVNADGIANCFAERVPLKQGLNAHAQQILRANPLAWLNYCSALFPAGFYYRAFFRPQGVWPWWEKMFRRIAGLGKVEKHAERYYDKAYAFCDVAVIGGGLAGITAARECARLGLETILIEREAHLGADECQEKIAPENVSKALPANLKVMTSAQATGIFSDIFIAVAQQNNEGQRLYKIRARRCIVASGSHELPAVFPNNDLPAIMLASAAKKLLRLYGVLAGERPVIFTANQHGYQLAEGLLAAGSKPIVLDARKKQDAVAKDQSVINSLASDIPCFYNARIHEALGHKSVRAVRVWIDDELRLFPCDCLCLAVGFTPAAELLVQAGARVNYDTKSACMRIEALSQGIDATGSLAGFFDRKKVIADAMRAANDAAIDIKGTSRTGTKTSNTPEQRDDTMQNIAFPFYPQPQDITRLQHKKSSVVQSVCDKLSNNKALRRKAFVDFDEDLQVSDFSESLRDGYQDMQLVKRYTTLGMGVSQGRHSNINGLRLVAALSGEQHKKLGLSTTRPPAAPESFALLAGRSFEPVRLTPMHSRHLNANGKMMVAGTWLRPAYYSHNYSEQKKNKIGKVESKENIIANEALAVRNAVGIIDVTTLGGIDIYGAQTAEFVERLYSWSYQKQAVGRARYLLMTDESGVIVDDGVCCRFSQEHMYLTTTTGGSDAVYREMLFWKAQWNMEVEIINSTAAYAAVNVAGPLSRKLLEGLCEGVDLSAQAFPYMGVRQGKVAKCNARLLRVGFVGELGYEIHVPFAEGQALWDALLAHGAKWNLKPFGVEAQRLLRLEKGHIIIGQDTDGLTIPQEAGMAWAVAQKKPFFIGKRAIEIQVANGTKRRLVGFVLTKVDLAHMPKECNLVMHKGEIDGRVTSIAYSPTLKQTIGLAFIEKSQNSLEIKLDSGRHVHGRIVALPFYDAEGARQLL